MMTKIYATASRYPQSHVQYAGPLGMLVTAFSIWRERRHLAALDDAMLTDIGKSRQDAVTEASRAVWDAPNRWFL